MRTPNAFLLLLYTGVAFTFLQYPISQIEVTGAKHLRLSAVVNEHDPPYHAKIECWELEVPFHDYPTIGTFLPLANISNLTYVTLPPRSTEGLHHPPHPMFFILIAGCSHVTLPNDPSSEGLWITEGINPVIIATDTLGIGHNTTYPDEKATIALQAPFQDGVLPEHKVVSRGACPVVKG